MPWVVDGNNLAGGSDREAVRRSILELARRQKLRVVLFFDGAPPAGVPPVEKLGSVEVRYVAQADAAILQLLARDGRGWRLVSSDRLLASKARMLGAEVVSAAAFRRRLEAGGGSGEKPQPASTVPDSFAGVVPLPEQPLRIRPRRPKRR